MDGRNRNFHDSKTMLILLATMRPKTATEISHDCGIPLSTTYRKLAGLLQYNQVKICGKITNGRRYLLYTNNVSVQDFKNSHRALSIMNTVICNPGICFRDVTRLSGLTNGVVSHYIHKLQKKGMVFIRRSRRKSWHFASDLPPDEMEFAIHLRNTTSHAIVSRLLESQHLTFHQLTESIERCPASISSHLSKLQQGGFVKKSGDLHPVYCLKDPSFASKMLSLVHYEKRHQNPPSK